MGVNLGGASLNGPDARPVGEKTGDPTNGVGTAPKRGFPGIAEFSDVMINFFELDELATTLEFKFEFEFIRVKLPAVEEFEGFSGAGLIGTSFGKAGLSGAGLS